MRRILAFLLGLGLAGVAGAPSIVPAQGPPPIQQSIPAPPSMSSTPSMDDGEVPQQFEFHAPPAADDPNTPAVMRDLAERMLPVYSDPNREQYLANLATFQMVAGDYEAAFDSRQSLKERRKAQQPDSAVGRPLVYDMYARARALESEQGIPFEQAFTQTFREVMPQLSDPEGYALTGWLDAPVPPFRDAVQTVFDKLRQKETITLPEAIDVIWTYLAFDAHRSFAPLIDALASDEAGRRYAAEEDVMIGKMRGNEIYARVIRPKNADKPMPALLEYKLDPSRSDAKSSAAHGYVGVVAYARGPAKGNPQFVPFEHDGEYVRAVIEWIAKQPWSDGRVGMIGVGYGGFAAWAAMKNPPAALKAIATQDPIAPGIDFPFEGRVYRNDMYRWALVNTQGVVDTGDDDAQWEALDRDWYRSGQKYRAFDRLARKPSRLFARWLNHPSYDLYWRKMIPTPAEMKKIDVPIFASTGYFSDGAVGTLFYFDQQLKARPDADHTLLIGPWDERGMQSRSTSEVRGYRLDAAAQIDLRELRFQWFDHIFRNADKPDLLQDRVNWQVMGANQWRHASTVADMAAGAAPLRFFLDGSDPAQPVLASAAVPDVAKMLQQIVTLKDRTDVDAEAPISVQGPRIDRRNALVFTSPPLEKGVEVAGLLSGSLDVVVNKMDVDLVVTAYEQLPTGEYLQLADPYEFRASYLKDRVHRRLLQAGVRQNLPFTSEQVAGRRVGAGSRIVIVLGVLKRPDREINYGAGNDVSVESIRDARVPMRIRWYGTSYVDVPVR